MKKEIEKITSEMTLSMNEIFKIPQIRHEEIITRELSHLAAETIINNFKNLPVEYKHRTDKITGGEIYRLEFNIISNDELKRLRLIEKKYINDNWIEPV